MTGAPVRPRVWLYGWALACVLAVAPSAWAQTSRQIYADGLLDGWQDWSWAAVDLASGSPVHSGTLSARVTADAWEAIYLHHAAFATAGYTDLVFWIHGGASGGQLLQVQALLGGTPQAAVVLAPLAANAWQQITISLASLGVADKPNMDGFWIQDRSGATSPAFHVDDVSLAAIPPPAAVGVAVDASQTLRTADARHFGMNAAIWDAAFDTPTTIGLLTEMANQTLRFPGGSLSNDYHWHSNTTGDNTWQWATSFDEFARVATATGAQVFISVNYGSGTPAEAAEWVRHANVTRGYGFKYWEIGNENYGAWETDVNARPHDPYTYAQRFRDYYTQMKAVDATIKIGAVAITGEDSYATYTDHPATNPRTGAVHNGWTPVMLATLKSLGVTPDFLVYHRYPQGPGAESDAGLLQSSSGWAADAADLRRQLTDYLGAAGAQVELVCTENNSVFTSPGKQTTSLVNGLFLADSLGQVMKTELNGLIWWALRNSQETGNNNAASLYGWRPYGDYGVVSGATPAGPADRYPTFYVAKLLQHFARGGDALVAASSDYGLLSVYAARRANGSLALLAVNKSPTTALDADVTLTGFSPTGPLRVHSYGIPQDDAARTGVGSADVASSSAGAVGSTFAFTFPAYSATVLVLESTAEPPAIVAPAPGSTLTSHGVTFTGGHTAADLQHWLYVGTSPGESDLLSRDLGTGHTADVGGLPSGGTIYVRYWTRFASGWQLTDQQYTMSVAPPVAPAIVTPAPGSVLTSNTVAFTGGHTGADLQHFLYVGTTPGHYQIAALDLGADHAATVSGLPDSGTIYVRYWTRFAGGWQLTDQPYTMRVPTGAQPIVCPAPGMVLPSTTITFTGGHTSADLQHYLYVGTSPGHYQIAAQDLGAGHTATVSGLPVSGTIYVRYWTRLAGGWQLTDQQYTMNVTGGPPPIVCPTPGATVPGGAVTFTGGHASTNLQHWLYVGTSPGGYDLFSQDLGTGHAVTVTGLPASGTIYVRYWTRFGAGWQLTDQHYTLEAP
jgi:hypothetical protein